MQKYGSVCYIKHFTCWNQLLSLMFGQFFNREGLRPLIAAFDAHCSKCYHLGLGRHVTRSNLVKANENRDFHIFEDFPHDMKLNHPLYEILQILGISLTDKTQLLELLIAKDTEKQEKVENKPLDLFKDLFLC